MAHWIFQLPLLVPTYTLPKIPMRSSKRDDRLSTLIVRNGIMSWGWTPIRPRSRVIKMRVRGRRAKTTLWKFADEVRLSCGECPVPGTEYRRQLGSDSQPALISKYTCFTTVIYHMQTNVGDSRCRRSSYMSINMHGSRLRNVSMRIPIAENKLVHIL